MPLVLTFPLSIIVTRQSQVCLIEYARKRLSRPEKIRTAPNMSRPFRRAGACCCRSRLIAIGLYWFAAPTMYNAG